MTDTVTISREVLEQAQEQVCSYCCPSTWKTAEGRPPHSSLCQAITAALSSPPPPSGLREALVVTEQAKRFIHGNESVFGGHPEYDQGWQGACDHIAEQLRLASPDDGWVKVDKEHPLPRDLKENDEVRHVAGGQVEYRRRRSEQGG